MSGLPGFRYHPDPVSTRSVVAQEIECGVCGKPREYAYVGPYATPDWHFENGDALCPWCIADGSAAAGWSARFTTEIYLSDRARAAMPAGRIEELEQRTPAFLCLQQEYWLDHHDEAMAYVGAVGADEYTALPPAARVAVRDAAGDKPQGEPDGGDNVWRLRWDGDGPTVYLFRCLHCEEYRAFLAAD
jgi:uncharacterized protein CbrC (UPF0167 family)